MFKKALKEQEEQQAQNSITLEELVENEVRVCVCVCVCVYVCLHLVF